ncbi:MAG: OpgC domain-containing protein, partial [Acetobacteraceae bacterium]
VARLVPKDANWLRSRIAAPVVLMGQHSLPVFCWSIFIGFFGRLGLEWRGGALMQLVVNGGGFAAMVAVAAIAAWYGERGRVPREAPAAAPAPGTARLRVPLLVLTLAFAAMRAATAAPDLCPPDPDLIAAPGQLDAFAHAVRAGGPVDVLAIGSASTAAGGVSYPRVMTEALQTALPGADLRLTVNAARGLSAADMLGQMPEALAQHRYALVLWQTGTVDAVQGLRPEELAQALEQGAALVAAAGASLVLIDFQYSRFLGANVDLAPYEQALERTASLPGVALFHRYVLMRSWAEAGGLDIEMVPPAKRPETAGLLHACLGHALAHFILGGIEVAPATH